MTIKRVELSNDLASRLRWRLRGLRYKPRRDNRPHEKGAPLVIAGMFRTNSGIGKSASICADALRAEGYDPELIDVSGLFGQVDDEDFPSVPGKLPDGEGGTLILHLNGPETERALFELGALSRKNWRIIGYWAWELNHVPKAWLPVSRYLSEIWTPSTFVTKTFAGQVDCPVLTVPHYVHPPHRMALPGEGDGVLLEGQPLVCLVMADGRSSFYRKNVLGSLSVFESAFPDRQDARLIVKSRNLNEFPEYADELERRVAADPRIEILDGNLDDWQKWSLLADADFVISAHRAEGFGLHLAEAMAIGLPVVATNWSGNLDFMSPESAGLMNYRLVPVDDPADVYSDAGNAFWAEPDIEQGAALLKTLAEDGDLRRRVSRQARRAVLEKLTSASYRSALLGEI